MVKTWGSISVRPQPTIVRLMLFTNGMYFLPEIIGKFFPDQA